MILVARHGETEWNTVGRMQGRKDSTLTDVGTGQAEQLARVVDTYDVEQILSSPLGRAMQTSEIVSSHTGLPIESDDRLKEIDIGEYSGLTRADVSNRNPGFWERRADSKWDFNWPGGESYADAHERIGPFVRDRDYIRGSAIIGHRSVNRVLIGYLLDLDPAEMLDIEQQNDVIFEIRDSGTLKRQTYDDVLQSQ